MQQPYSIRPARFTVMAHNPVAGHYGIDDLVTSVDKINEETIKQIARSLQKRRRKEARPSRAELLVVIFDDRTGSAVMRGRITAEYMLILPTEACGDA